MSVAPIAFSQTPGGICTRVYSLRQTTTLRKQGTDFESHDGGGDGCEGDEGDGDGDGDSDDGNDWKMSMVGTINPPHKLFLGNRICGPHLWPKRIDGVVPLKRIGDLNASHILPCITVLRSDME